MTAIIVGLLVIAVYFQWSAITVGIISVCAMVALALDTRVLLRTGKNA